MTGDYERALRTRTRRTTSVWDRRVVTLDERVS
jgi:hypothetical protein